jgi:hypothetical protein
MGAHSMRWLAVLTAFALQAQVIDFESNGLHFKTLTKNGLTIMFAHIGSHVKEYSILQVAVSNGSNEAWTVRPEDFSYYRQDADEEGQPSRRHQTGVYLRGGHLWQHPPAVHQRL